jgi:MFS family permease
VAQLTAAAARRSPGVTRSLFWLLGFGAFGLAFSITTTAAYLPPLLNRFTESGTLIGLVLGAEGVFALLLSPVIGPWSDTFHTPLGRRRPFMLAAIGPMGFCLLLLPFMPNLWTTTLIVLAFFFAYYVYEPPYRGLYPDLLPPSTYGRAQGIQHVLRGIALGAALVGGGFLLKAWHAAPFVLAAFVTVGACAVPIIFVREDGGHGRVFEGVSAYFKRSWALLRQEAEVRRFLIANAAWEGTFAAARTFVVLYVIDGLNETKAISSAVLGAVATGYVIAAVIAGRLGDRFGIARVIFFASFVYGGGYLVAGFATTWQDWYFGLIVPVAIAGGMVMTLAWGLLFKLMPQEHRGAISGLATTPTSAPPTATRSSGRCAGSRSSLRFRSSTG